MPASICMHVTGKRVRRPPPPAGDAGRWLDRMDRDRFLDSKQSRIQRREADGPIKQSSEQAGRTEEAASA